jgi:hypothetical protein
MKKLFFTFLSMAFSLYAFPQAGVGIGMGGGGFGMGMHIPLSKKNDAEHIDRNIEYRVQEMKTDLKLDDKQTVKLRGILIERERRKQGPNPMSPKEYNERLREFLTPEQYNTLVDIRKQRQQQQKIQPNKKQGEPQPANNQDPDDVYN